MIEEGICWCRSDRIRPVKLCSIDSDSGVIDFGILDDEIQTASQTVTGARPLIEPRISLGR